MSLSILPLKKWWIVLSDLVEASGFGWNPDINEVEAENCIWERYLKVR